MMPDKPEREEKFTECPECGEQIPCEWHGKQKDVYYCEKCPLLVSKEK